jgi:predicted nucleic acid-binding protein
VLVVDTNVLYAVADANDNDHAACDEQATQPRPLLVPTPIVVETSWLISDRLGASAEIAFLRSVISGELRRVDLTEECCVAGHPGRF